jgi:hypothetical protein
MEAPSRHLDNQPATEKLAPGTLRTKLPKTDTELMRPKPASGTSCDKNVEKMIEKGISIYLPQKVNNVDS